MDKGIFIKKLLKNLCLIGASLIFIPTLCLADTTKNDHSHSDFSRFALYGGGFGGVTIPAYQISAVYFTTNFNAREQPLNKTFTPTSSEEGFDLGFLIHFLHRYHTGVEYNFTSYNKPDATTSFYIDGFVNNIATPIEIVQATQLNYTHDILFSLGASISQQVNLFFKFGVSYMQLLSQLSTVSRLATGENTLNFPQEKRNLTGFVFALNFSYDISQYFSIFTEYAYHSYGSALFSNLRNIVPANPALPDQLTNRTVNIRSNSIRFGLNVYLYTT